MHLVSTYGEGDHAAPEVQRMLQHHCYDTTGSSDDKSLGGALAILGDDTKSYGPDVI